MLSQVLYEWLRAKRKSATENLAPVDFAFCEEKEICRKGQKSKNNLRNYTQQGNTTQVFKFS